MNKMKLIMKLVSLICIVLCVISICNSSSAVTDADVKKFGGTQGSITGASAVQKIIATILDIVRLVGAAVAIVVLMTIAAKYMMASAGDRADIKKYAFNYIVGAVILFAASGILTMIRDSITK